MADLPNPSTPPPPTSDHKVADPLNSIVKDLDIPNLKDADSAGSPSESCTLFLVEGVAAQTFADAALKVLGQQLYGSLALKGVPINVTDKKRAQYEKNHEFVYIKRVLGLEYDQVYDDKTVKKLRYQHLTLMCDQDHPGSHIKGLIINMFQTLWPSLLKVKKFIRMFVTPLIKVKYRLPLDRRTLIKKFYTMSSYKWWWSNLEREQKRLCDLVYYKGLASHPVDEAYSYFKEFDKHVRDFIWVDETDDYAIQRSFADATRHERKVWLHEAVAQASQSQANTSGDYLDSKEIRYLDFGNIELRDSGVDCIQRSIPSMVDGLKRSQRKVLHYFLGRLSNKEIEVSRISGLVADRTSYHHSEKNLAGVIVGMARDYVGTNNINLLVPKGVFGTREEGSKESPKAARYVHTKLCPITRFIFHIDDEHLLNYYRFGLSVEPEWFLPIIPMILVNGTDALSVGCKSNIPNYNPLDIISNLIRLMKGEPLVRMLPWYKNFNGEIEETTPGNFHSKGIIKVDNNVLRITELPVGTWTEVYKKKVLNKDLKRGIDYESYTARNDKDTVDFEIVMNSDQMEMARGEKGFEKFKLTSQLKKHMYLLDQMGKIKKYHTPEEILTDFYSFRLSFYKKRRMSLLRELVKAALILQYQIKYVTEVRAGDVTIISARGADLENKGFPPLRTIVSMAESAANEEIEVMEDLGVVEENPDQISSDYLSEAFPKLSRNDKKRLNQPKWKSILPSIELKADEDSDEGGEDEDEESDEDGEDEDEESDEDGEDEDGEDEEEERIKLAGPDHDYLLSIRMKELDLKLLNEEKKKKEREFEMLKNTSSKSLWQDDLHALYLQLKKLEGKRTRL